MKIIIIVVKLWRIFSSMCYMLGKHAILIGIYYKIYVPTCNFSCHSDMNNKHSIGTCTDR